jgi:hypothetical protein
MLGILGIIALLLGGFAAGGGAFDWAFLFSDGYREHTWARSLGREGARGLLILFGSVLMVVGFISQVVDSASKPVRVISTSLDKPLTASDDRDGSAPQAEVPEVTGSTPNLPLTTPPPAPRIEGPAAGAPNSPPASYLPSRSGNSATAAEPGPQLVTIWHPEAVPEDADTLVMLQYRFESGHWPWTGFRYFWIIDLPDHTTEVESDGETLQRRGQLIHVFHTPLQGSGFQSTWSTVLMVEANGRRQQVSNRLEITPEGVRSTPLLAPPR